MTRWKKAGLTQSGIRYANRNFYREEYFSLVRESARFRRDAAEAFEMHRDALKTPYWAHIQFNDKSARQFAHQLDAARNWWRVYRKAIKDARESIKDAARLRKTNPQPYFDTTALKGN